MSTSLPAQARHPHSSSTTSSATSTSSIRIPLPPPQIHTRRSPAPPAYRQPHLLTTYSHLPDRSIVHSDASMAYYRPAPAGCDLSYGFERRVERDERLAGEEHLDGLCESLMRLEGRTGERVERCGGVITWRGMITKIMTAPFEDRDGWEMNCVALGGSVYLELHEPAEARQQKRKQEAAWALQGYMGYAYESFSTYPSGDGDPASDPEAPGGWGGDVNTNVQWCNVVRSAIGDVPLLLGGEVDCVRAPPGSPHPGLDGCVELKTNKVITNDRQEAVFHKKLLKHWAQSWLLGIPVSWQRARQRRADVILTFQTVVVGFRDDDGILREQRTFETQRIPQFIASLPRPPWHPAPALHFLHAVLSLLTAHVLPTDPILAGSPADGTLPRAVPWRLKYEPRKGCELFQLREGAASQDPERWGGILTEEYVRWRLRSTGYE